MRKNFQLYADYKGQIDMLTCCDKASLVDYIFDYVNDKEMNIEGAEPIVKMLFLSMLPQLDASNESFDEYKSKMENSRW